ncbi:MAG TPA: hypothetical protein VIW03_07120 [Anaeromyxobacter sp.]
MAEAADSAPSVRTRVAWALAVAALAIGAVGAMEVRGHSARRTFEPGADLQGRRVAVVGSAADAFRVWHAAGVRGRHLVVLTGQWSRPRSASPHGAPEQASEQAARGEQGPDAASALFVAWRLGIVRSFDVVMPPAAFTRRLGEVAGRKGLSREDGAFRLRYDGVERRFSTPRAFAAPAEQALVVVEPSWFSDGASPEPLAWLAARGVSWDLAIVALEDPVATGEERLAAMSFARAAGAVRLEAVQ